MQDAEQPAVATLEPVVTLENERLDLLERLKRGRSTLPNGCHAIVVLSNRGKPGYDLTIL
jgi:hypothetical protein